MRPLLLALLLLGPALAGCATPAPTTPPTLSDAPTRSTHDGSAGPTPLPPSNDGECRSKSAEGLAAVRSRRDTPPDRIHSLTTATTNGSTATILYAFDRANRSFLLDLRAEGHNYTLAAVGQDIVYRSTEVVEYVRDHNPVGAFSGELQQVDAPVERTWVDDLTIADYIVACPTDPVDGPILQLNHQGQGRATGMLLRAAPPYPTLKLTYRDDAEGVSFVRHYREGLPQIAVDTTLPRAARALGVVPETDATHLTVGTGQWAPVGELRVVAFRDGVEVGNASLAAKVQIDGVSLTFDDKDANVLVSEGDRFVIAREPSTEVRIFDEWAQRFVAFGPDTVLALGGAPDA